MPVSLLHTGGYLLFQSMFRPASAEAEHIDRLSGYFMIAAGFILTVVIVLAVYICIRFRYRPDRPPVAGVRLTSKVEFLTIGIPTLLVVFFFYLTLTGMRQLMPDGEPESRQPDVIITGHQWWWEAEYPGTDVITANEIHFPTDRQLLIELRSFDVIHDWWVPALGPKMDMVPGRSNYLKLNIQKPGVYLGACSEFCGIQHAWMRIRVEAQTPQDFEQWIQQQSKVADMPADSLARRGAEIFQNTTCAGCHRIRGTPAQNNEGPDLTHLTSRSTLLSGMLTNNKDNIREWISYPQKIKPGANMPDFIFDTDTIQALVAYLRQLD